MEVPTELAALVRGSYRNLVRVGAGAQSLVFRAESTADGAEVALKWAQEGASAAAEFAHLASVRHPNLVGVREILQSRAGSCLVCEYVAGPSAGQHLRALPKAARTDAVLELLLGMASALAHLHDQGLVHGDLSPDQMLWPGDGQPMLVDLGLVRPAGPGDCRGTPQFMAPETLAGHLDAQSEVYGLGLCVLSMVCGSDILPPKGDVFAAICKGVTEVAAKNIPEWLPDALASLLLSMIDPDRSGRPQSMVAVMAHLRRISEALGQTPLESAHRIPRLREPPFVGREAEVAALTECLQEFESQPTSALCAVFGAPGSGRSRLIAEALLKARVEAAKARRPFPLVLSCSIADLPAAPSDTPRILVLENCSVAELSAAHLPGRTLAIAECTERPRFADRCIALSQLSERACLDLCQAMGVTSEDWARAAAQFAHRLPGPLLARIEAAHALDPGFSRAPIDLLEPAILEAEVLARVRMLPKVACELLEQLAVAGGPRLWPDACERSGLSSEEFADAVSQLVDAGLVAVRAGAVACQSPEYAAAIDRALPVARRKALHREELQRGEDLSIGERARHTRVAGPRALAARLSLEAIADARASGQLGRARELCRVSAELMRGSAASQLACEAAELALAAGDYADATTHAEKAHRSRDPELRLRATKVLAKVAQHRGDLDTAVAQLSALASAYDDTQARAELSRVLLRAGRYDEARAQAQRCLQDQGEADRALETLGLASLYQGELADAERYFERLISESSSGEGAARGKGLLGMLYQQQSKLERATELYREAAEESRAAGALHSAAVFHLNQATALERRAHYGEALSAYDDAHHSLLRSGTPFELCAAYRNRGNLLLTLGELASARAQAERAKELAREAGEPRIQYFTELLLGEVCEREHDEANAGTHFERAKALAEEHALSEGVYAHLRLATWNARTGGEAESHLAAVRHLASEGRGISEEYRDEELACRARVALVQAAASPGLAEKLEEAIERAHKSGDLDLGWRLSTLLARVYAATGNEGAAQTALAKAEALVETVIRACPEAYVAGLKGHPDIVALASVAKPSALERSAGGEKLPLRRLLALSRKLNSEQNIDRLLEEIIDTAVELSHAERAFLLLRDSSGALRFRVARNMSREELGDGERLSTSIAESVAETGRVVLTVDAESDRRFDASKSVAALELRSILAVPFRVKDRIVGTLYLDHRFRRAAFDEDAVEVVRELADLAAVAIENARLLRENRAREAEVRALNRQLEEALQTTEVELAQTRAKLRAEPRRSSFQRIVGKSREMRELFAIAERAAGCALPVVISGESGTGKELLARAIHDESSRSEAAFVPINCGAVPEELLEAELFGYKRGAFTGAERGKRGLFEVADGGTLFLDEVADTSLSMQTKLLRAIQEGEIRPLGAESVRHVDIRIVCATNKPLWDEVKAGRFREDLFYRLRVLELHVPALRERRSDIPHIARSLLPDDCALSPEAIRVLLAHDWPGNVRELENELARAHAMSDAPCIAPSDLSPHLIESARGQPRAVEPEEAFALKPQVEALERALVEGAMARTGNNQSKAATLLGLSRYGLQKKLQRYGLSGSRG